MHGPLKDKFIPVQNRNEWDAAVIKWRKRPNQQLRHISGVTIEELGDRHIWYCDIDGAPKADRDMGLVTFERTGTPIPNTFFWVYGINSLR